MGLFARSSHTPEDLAHGQIVIVTFRWIMVAAGFVFALWNPEPVAELRVQILVILALAVANFYLHAQVLRRRPALELVIYAARGGDVAPAGRDREPPADPCRAHCRAGGGRSVRQHLLAHRERPASGGRGREAWRRPRGAHRCPRGRRRSLLRSGRHHRGTLVADPWRRDCCPVDDDRDGRAGDADSPRGRAHGRELLPPRPLPPGAPGQPRAERRGGPGRSCGRYRGSAGLARFARAGQPVLCPDLPRARRLRLRLPAQAVGGVYRARPRAPPAAACPPTTGPPSARAGARF